MKRTTSLLCGALIAASTLIAAAPASAAVVRYEAENYLSTTTSTAKDVINAPAASGGKYLAMYSGGVVEVPVYSSVKRMLVSVKGTACKNPAETKPGSAEYQLLTFPAYVQHDAFIDPASFYSFDTWGAFPTFNQWFFDLPYGGYSFGPFAGGGAPNRLQVKFLRDYSRWVNGVKECDRNLFVDYIEVTT